MKSVCVNLTGERYWVLPIIRGKEIVDSVLHDACSLRAALAKNLPCFLVGVLVLLGPLPTQMSYCMKLEKGSPTERMDCKVGPLWAHRLENRKSCFLLATLFRAWCWRCKHCVTFSPTHTASAETHPVQP